MSIRRFVLSADMCNILDKSGQQSSNNVLHITPTRLLSDNTIHNADHTKRAKKIARRNSETFEKNPLFETGQYVRIYSDGRQEPRGGGGGGVPKA